MLEERTRVVGALIEKMLPPPDDGLSDDAMLQINWRVGGGTYGAVKRAPAPIPSELRLYEIKSDGVVQEPGERPKSCEVVTWFTAEEVATVSIFKTDGAKVIGAGPTLLVPR